MKSTTGVAEIAKAVTSMEVTAHSVVMAALGRIEAAWTHLDAHDNASAEAMSYFPRPSEFALGPDKYLEQLRRIKNAVRVPVIASLNGTTGRGWTEYARRIEQASGEAVLLNQGTIYASLVRLQQRGWIAAEWGASDNNRKARFYTITRQGKKQLAEDADYWRRLADLMGRMLAPSVSSRMCLMRTAV